MLLFLGWSISVDWSGVLPGEDLCPQGAPVPQVRLHGSGWRLVYEVVNRLAARGVSRCGRRFHRKSVFGVMMGWYGEIDDER